MKHSDKMFSGFLFGLLLGGMTALFRGPRIRVLPAGSSLHEALKDARSNDALQESIEEGKAAARRLKQ